MSMNNKAAQKNDVGTQTSPRSRWHTDITPITRPTLRVAPIQRTPPIPPTTREDWWYPLRRPHLNLPEAPTENNNI